MKEMQRARIPRVCCDMVRLVPNSRKWQEHVREIPGRINFTKLNNPALGLTEWVNGDMATTLQAYYIKTGAHKLSAEQLESTPMLATANGAMVSAKRLTKALKDKAIEKGIDPATVTLHGLRIGRITDLVNGEMKNNSVGLTRATGHACMANLDPYVRLGVGQAIDVTNALKY